MNCLILKYEDPSYLYCQGIRRKVFIEEQNVPEAREQDGFDPECRHYLFEHENRPVGTGRSRLDAKGGAKMIKIERFAFLPEARGLKLGEPAFQFMLDDCRKAYPALPIVIGAQAYLKGFYERLGFMAEGEIFQDAGIDHFRMIYNNYL